MAVMNRGVFCLEGEWHPDDLTNESSVSLLLETLSKVRGKDFAYIHRRVAKEDELNFYLKKWLQQKYKSYGVLSLAMHGTKKKLQFAGTRNEISLEQLQETIDGRGKGRIIYLGSCDTLNIERSEIKEFKKKTKVLAVIGYEKTVEWIEAAAFEMLLFDLLTYYKTMSAVEKRLRSDYQSLSKKLGLVFVS